MVYILSSMRSMSVIFRYFDWFQGTAVLAELQRDSVGTELIQIAKSPDSPTTFTFVLVDNASASRTCIATVIKEELTSEEAAAVAPQVRGAQIVHMDSRHTEASLRLAELLSEGRAGGPLLSIDVERDRPPHLQQLLPRCHLVFTNEQFAQVYFADGGGRGGGGAELSCPVPPEGPEPACARLDEDIARDDFLVERLQLLLRLFENSETRVVVCTLGGRGSLLLRRRSCGGGGEGGVLRTLRGSAHEEVDDGSALPRPRQRGEEAAARGLPACRLLRLKVASTASTASQGSEWDVLRCSACGPPLLRAEDVRDTTGAGDAFIGGFLAALLLLPRGGGGRRRRSCMFFAAVCKWGRWWPPRV